MLLLQRLLKENVKMHVNTKNPELNITNILLPERLPKLGELVQLRSRRWLVEEVINASDNSPSLIRLACADDDAQGQSLDVFWEYELDRQILEAEGWQNLGSKGFDSPRYFSAFFHTLRWSSVTATDPNLFQAPFRAGIKIEAYQSRIKHTCVKERCKSHSVTHSQVLGLSRKLIESRLTRMLRLLLVSYDIAE